MKKTIVILAALVLAGLNSTSFASSARVSNPTAIVAELAGRGLLYNIGIDRVLSDEFSAGAGFGTAPMNFSNDTSANTNAHMMPFYANYYILPESGSPFLTLGLNLVLNSNSVNGLKSSPAGLDFGTSPFQPTFGAGYEYRSDAGYLFRAAAYGIVARNVVPWAGFTVGYSF